MMMTFTFYNAIPGIIPSDDYGGSVWLLGLPNCLVLNQQMAYSRKGN